MKIILDLWSSHISFYIEQEVYFKVKDKVIRLGGKKKKITIIVIFSSVMLLNITKYTISPLVFHCFRNSTGERTMHFHYCVTSCMYDGLVVKH